MADEPPRALRHLVQKYRVTWDVWPLRSYTQDHRPLQVGFVLDLQGAYPPDRPPSAPGDHEGEAIYRALREIAQWALAAPGDAAEYEVLLFDRGIHHARRRGFRDEVVLEVHIKRRAGHDRPVDAGAEACVRRAEERLAALGAQKGTWRGAARG